MAEVHPHHHPRASSFARCAREPDPVVIRGITLVPKHGVPVEVVARR